MPDSNSLKQSHVWAFPLFLVYPVWLNSLNMLSHVNRGDKDNQSSLLIYLSKTETWVILQGRRRGKMKGKVSYLSQDGP